MKFRFAVSNWPLLIGGGALLTAAKLLIGPDVDVNAVDAVEQSGNARAYLIFKVVLAPAIGLRLTGHDQPRRVLHRGLKRLSGKENQGGLENGESQPKEWKRDQAEFDGHGATLLARKAAR